MFAEALARGAKVGAGGAGVGGGGLACGAHLAYVEDEIIRAIHDCVVTAHRRWTPRASASASSAVGGYGRGTLAPGSDIDLLFLLPYKDRARAESVVEAMLYVLWDLKQKVGHSTRTVDECLRRRRRT